MKLTDLDLHVTGSVCMNLWMLVCYKSEINKLWRSFLS